MKQGMRLRFQKGDAVAIAAVLLLAAIVFACFLPGREEPAAAAEIYWKGELVKTLPLDTPQEITLTGDYSNTIAVRDGKVAVTRSDCPGEDCVHSGWIGTSGRSVVCLPNGLEIRVVGARGDVDFVVG